MISFKSFILENNIVSKPLKDFSEQDMQKSRNDAAHLSAGFLHGFLDKHFHGNISAEHPSRNRMPETSTAHVGKEGTLSFEHKHGRDGSSVDAIDLHGKLIDGLAKHKNTKVISKGVSESYVNHNGTIFRISSSTKSGGGAHRFGIVGHG